MLKLTYQYQEIVSLQSQSPVAVELLLRVHPAENQLETLTNPKFFSKNLIELSFLKSEYSEKVLSTRNIWIFINFSKNQISQEHFKHAIFILLPFLKKTNVIIEVTECNAPYNSTLFNKNIKELKTAGFQLAVDDFGTGSSNFKALKLIEPDFVKLDISLIKDATTSKSKEISFYRLVDTLRHSGYKVVIEGIESNKELRIAKRTRAELGQGYFFHCPESV